MTFGSYKTEQWQCRPAWLLGYSVHISSHQED